MTSRAAWPVENSAAGATTAARKTRMMLFMQYDSIVDSLRLLRIIARFGDASGGSCVSTSLSVRCVAGVFRRGYADSPVVLEPIAITTHAGARCRVECRQGRHPHDACDWTV